nr:large proline-rich protein [Tanacetum cinerariifolium]
MSGVSLAVAPRSEPDETSPTTANQKTAVGGIMGSLRVIELQLVAFIMVFSAIGLVPLFDLAFPVFTTVYLLVLSRLAFPGHGTSTTSKELFQGNRIFRAYVILGTTVGLFLPLAYVLGGFARGDEHSLRSATPHLFLLSCQILTENIISGLSLFSPPVRALVPMLYTVRRIFVILDWVQDGILWKNNKKEGADVAGDVGGDVAEVLRLSHGGDVEADGNCLFTASKKAMGLKITAKELRKRAVKRFLDDVRCGESDVIDEVIKHLYCPDLKTGWGVSFVQEVKMLAKKDDRGCLDEGINELVNLGMQRIPLDWSFLRWVFWKGSRPDTSSHEGDTSAWMEASMVGSFHGVGDGVIESQISLPIWMNCMKKITN